MELDSHWSYKDKEGCIYEWGILLYPTHTHPLVCDPLLCTTKPFSGSKYGEDE
jgi:hypothetical protein